MGKTHKGAVWLDPERTTPYEYYQFWINTDDADVVRFLSLFTFLPMTEILAVGQLEGSQLNGAKAVLAFEATSIAHGKEEALKAFEATAAMFGVPLLSDTMLPTSAIPRGGCCDAKVDSVPSSVCHMSQIESEHGLTTVDLFLMAGLASSKGEARRLIAQGGGYINGERVNSFDQKITKADIDGGEILLRAGKKKFHKIIMKK